MIFIQPNFDGLDGKDIIAIYLAFNILSIPGTIVYFTCGTELDPAWAFFSLISFSVVNGIVLFLVLVHLIYKMLK